MILGCTPVTTQRRTTTIINFLYPDEQHATTASTVKPVIIVPLKVGFAFVPALASDNFPESEKSRLMQEVAAHFESYEFVRAIEIIPSLYLEQRGGFPNLDKLRQMFGIDVIMLLSYDQSQFKDTGAASITYWTLVGAYFIKGEKNDTHTLMDAALLHIESRNMLFRAQGISHLKSSATPINFTEQSRKDSNDGFHQASLDLMKNLREKLYGFRKTLRGSTRKFELKLKPGYQLRPLDSPEQAN
jgi:rhombotail lipoprotein